jgi:hypothetical protein
MNVASSCGIRTWRLHHWGGSMNFIRYQKMVKLDWWILLFDNERQPHGAHEFPWLLLIHRAWRRARRGCFSVHSLFDCFPVKVVAYIVAFAYEYSGSSIHPSLIPFLTSTTQIPFRSHHAYLIASLVPVCSASRSGCCTKYASALLSPPTLFERYRRGVAVLW